MQETHILSYNVNDILKDKIFRTCVILLVSLCSNKKKEIQKSKKRLFLLSV